MLQLICAKALRPRGGNWELGVGSVCRRRVAAYRIRNVRRSSRVRVHRGDSPHRLEFSRSRASRRHSPKTRKIAEGAETSGGCGDGTGRGRPPAGRTGRGGSERYDQHGPGQLFVSLGSSRPCARKRAARSLAAAARIGIPRGRRRRVGQRRRRLSVLSGPRRPRRVPSCRAAANGPWSSREISLIRGNAGVPGQ